MTEIPFVTQLGDALEEGIAWAQARRRGRRLAVPRNRGWLVVALAALALAGVAVAETLQSSTNLAASSISCISGTSQATAQVSSYDIEPNGRTPEQACSPVIGRPADTLVACVSGRYGIVVYEATGRADQCHALGMSVLPATYAGADAHVHQLILVLARLDRARDCIPPDTLAREVDAALERLGFPGWRAQVQVLPPQSGACGQFPGTGAAISDPAASLDSRHDVVLITAGPSRSMARVLTTAVSSLTAASGRRCYSLASIQSYVRRSLASAHVPVAFAATTEPQGEQADSGRQRFYDAGCAIVAQVGTSPDGRSILVQLEDLSSPPAPSDGVLAPGAYQPVLRGP